MRISDWSSDVCSSDLLRLWPGLSLCPPAQCRGFPCVSGELLGFSAADWPRRFATIASMAEDLGGKPAVTQSSSIRSEEHTSELQSLMRISYAVFCLKKKIKTDYTNAQPEANRQNIYTQ